MTSAALRSSTGSIYATGPESATSRLADLLDLSPPAWHADALCTEYPELDFFPHPADEDAIAAAIAVCQRCLVRPECDAAAEEGGEVGIWAAKLRLGNDQRRRGRRLPPGPRMDLPRHNNAGYASGCRCEECRQAHRDVAWAWTTRRAATD